MLKLRREGLRYGWMIGFEETGLLGCYTGENWGVDDELIALIFHS